ncbi:hypothetical protein [Shewanella sp. c952]|nr:hypothetical protein [Shewanella sp. c952]
MFETANLILLIKGLALKVLGALSLGTDSAKHKSQSLPAKP